MFQMGKKKYFFRQILDQACRVIYFQLHINLTYTYFCITKFYPFPLFLLLASHMCEKSHDHHRWPLTSTFASLVPVSFDWNDVVSFDFLKSHIPSVFMPLPSDTTIIWKM